MIRLLKCVSGATDLDIIKQLKQMRAQAPDTQTDSNTRSVRQRHDWVCADTDAGTYMQINTRKYLTAPTERILENHGAEQNKLV